MKCPYCDKDMEQGIMRNEHGIHWEKKASMLKYGYNPDDGEICLSPMKGWKVATVTAWLCRDCRKVIIDCPKEEA